MMIQDVPLALLLLAIAVAFFAMDFYFLSIYDRQRSQGKGWAWDYTLGTMAAGLIVTIQPIFLPQIGWKTEKLFGLGIQGFGLFCITISFVLHIWARRHLQKFYAERVEVQPDHKVIRSGPYAHMRHPVITSFFMLAFGVCLLNPAVTTALVLVYTLWDFTRAAMQEETLLCQQLPEYQNYMGQVPRFFPRLWRKS
ncbi:MAG: isoprenylcysteine carboxylmethyltransferase family protein [Chloroflexi bacterium]|nr:isoprenylcysteine carboxylmethyltransferase family protein [Chloroflexota bacterium]